MQVFAQCIVQSHGEKIIRAGGLETQRWDAFVESNSDVLLKRCTAEKKEAQEMHGV